MFRPFYSQVRAPETTERDFLWPIGTCHSREDALWWRAFFLAYGDDHDGREPSWSFNLLPLVFCGSDRLSGGYWCVFPIYGRHPHFLLMDDWRFVLWPIWMDYDIIEGGIANDRVFNTIELYAAGLTPMSEALRKLQYEKPNNQICLLSQPLVDKYLQFIEAKQIEA